VSIIKDIDSVEMINMLIAENLKELRRKRKLTLENVSELTGVSKSMLGQIERGESSPTISTLWKIANGLKVSFTSLMERVEQETVIINKADMTPVVSDQGRFRLFPIFPAHQDRSFEIIDLDLDPYAVSESQPHVEGTEEFTLVYEGALELVLGEGANERRYLIPKGSAIHYKSDVRHVYRNASMGTTRVVMVINYR
jgi:transcriptional regulator with XRE-family HTH domain